MDIERLHTYPQTLELTSRIISYQSDLNMLTNIAYIRAATFTF